MVESGLAKSYKQPITIEFRDAPLKQVFELIARRSGLNFVFDKDVKADAKTSIFLKNSTVESAVYFLLVTNQLEQQVMDANTILIYPNVAAKLKEYQEVLVKTFFLANADAKQVANTLKTILKTRDVVADEKLNLVIVRDTPEAIRLAERLIALQDVPEAGSDAGAGNPRSQAQPPDGTGRGLADRPDPDAAVSTSGGTGLTINDLNNLNQRTIGVSDLSVTANANKTDGDANILANPRIRVRNREKAKFVIGDKVPVMTTTISPGTGGFASESVTYLDVGLTLNAEPTIYLNNEVAHPHVAGSEQPGRHHHHQERLDRLPDRHAPGLDHAAAEGWRKPGAGGPDQQRRAQLAATRCRAWATCPCSGACSAAATTTARRPKSCCRSRRT